MSRKKTKPETAEQIPTPEVEDEAVETPEVSEAEAPAAEDKAE